MGIKIRKKYATLLTALITIIIVSPLDDIVLAAVCGTALFGFGSTAFYVLTAVSSAASITVWMWRKHTKQHSAKSIQHLPDLSKSL